MRLTVTVDTSALERRIAHLQREIPPAIAAGLTDTVRDVEREVQATLATELDRPRPFTVRAMYVKPATATRLTAVVGLKRMQQRYLAALIEGGPRAQKPSEERLGGRYFVPAPGVPLDAFGNVPRGVLRTILQAARTGKRYRGGTIIVGRPPGTTLQPGVWLRTKRAMKALLLFVDSAPSYRREIDFHGIAERTARARFEGHVRARMAAVIAGKR